MAPEKGADGSVSIGEVMIPVSPEAPCRARSAVDAWLLGLAAPDVRADACLLVSEVVTNSVRHSGMPAGAPLHVGAAMDADTVRVLVADQGSGGVRKRRPDDHGGFGLNLLDSLAARWGVEREPGTGVWFELPIGTIPAAAAG
jgi:anti-sigma regulatory factor (Ser/Thr protein kinase)